VEQGRLGVATIYLGGGVCGALGASLLQPNLYLVGASAGVYALLTSHLAHLYLVSEKVSQFLSTTLGNPRDPLSTKEATTKEAALKTREQRGQGISFPRYRRHESRLAEISENERSRRWIRRGDRAALRVT